MQGRLSTVSDYVDEVRTIIQDHTHPHRYDDASIVSALNIVIGETRRLRVDLFLSRNGIKVPQFGEKSGEPLKIEEQFQMAIVFGTAGYVLLRDDEDVQDARANAFIKAFQDILTGVRPGPIQGGTPGPGSPQK